MIKPADGDAIGAHDFGDHRHHRHLPAFRRGRSHHLHHDSENNATDETCHNAIRNIFVHSSPPW
jgi:hypothetical protein